MAGSVAACQLHPGLASIQLPQAGHSTGLCSVEKSIFIEISGSLDLTESQRVAITRNARVGLDIIWYGDCHKSIHNFVEKAQASISPPLL